MNPNTTTHNDETSVLKELFLATFFNDIEKILETKKKSPKLYAKKGCFPLDDIIIDLRILTLLNQTIWNDDTWSEEIQPLVERNRQKTRKMLAFWNSELAVPKLNKAIAYNSYYEFFYCEEPADTEKIDLNTVQFYVGMGFREIDARLHNRVECFDFAAVRKLLDQGANSTVSFYEDEQDAGGVFERIETEHSYLSSCSIIPEFVQFEKIAYQQNFDTRAMFGDLLGFAAHQEMYNLLNEYNKQ